MAGIYIHIPFCKKKCNYCDFYSSTNENDIDKFVKSLCVEISIQNDYLKNETVSTIYFGGGTPSLINEKQFVNIFETLFETFKIINHPEITIEVNPDDINDDYIKTLTSVGFNRISIGVQSFSNKELKYLNRRHNVQQAINSIEIANKFGFKNISADLIFGINKMSLNYLKQSLNTMISLPVNHISAYQLSYEQGTVLYKKLINKSIIELEDEECWLQFNFISDFLAQNKFLHYEISNFAKKNTFSKHNTNYWQGVKYLGLGPSAHSFNGEIRQWNIADIKQYITSINKGVISYNKEKLSFKDKFNEYIITRLRTMWGVDMIEIQNIFNSLYYKEIYNKSKKYIDGELMLLKDNQLILTTKGMFVSDMIIRDLMN